MAARLANNGGRLTPDLFMQTYMGKPVVVGTNGSQKEVGRLSGVVTGGPKNAFIQGIIVVDSSGSEFVSKEPVLFEEGYIRILRDFGNGSENARLDDLKR